MGGGILGIDDRRELNANQRRLEVAALQFDIAKDELTRDGIRCALMCTLNL
jgi:hypothetical protein